MLMRPSITSRPRPLSSPVPACRRTDRASATVIVHLDPQVVPSAVQPDADHPGTVPQGVGHQLIADQHRVVDVIAQAPLGQRLADEPAGLADLGRVMAELATDRTLLGDSRRHYRS
jgi:hypothetical protein